MTEDGQPLRVVFVGQTVYFGQCALTAPAGGLEPYFVDFRAGAAPAPLMERLAEINPDVVVVFRPEIIPGGLFGSLRALTIGYLTEPLPREPGRTHADLQARLGWLGRVDPENFDRIVCFDPLIAETAGGVLPVWRSLPIPVADEMFMEVHPRADPPRLLFVGRSTAHREALLAPIKGSHPIVHIGHGLFGDRLWWLLRRSDVQLNLHNNPYPTFENRVSAALAAGHLVITEPLSPDHGLAAGRDLIEIHDPAGLSAVVDALFADPAAHAEIQRAGRAQAERFRASAVYPALIRDARTDVETHGGRPAAG